jgi:acyl carrier protein
VTSGTAEESSGPSIDTIETLAVLREVPEVRDAVVTEYREAADHPVILGYVTGPDPGLGVGWIRQYLMTRLPDYLVPQHLFVLDELPLTSAGDYDLSALPRPDAENSAADDYVAPRTPMEEQLAEIIGKLLTIERVGIHDSFFQLGGFSLLATQLTSRIRETFYVDLSLRDVFSAPTVDQLAHLIVRMQGELLGDEQLEVLLNEISS